MEGDCFVEEWTWLEGLSFFKKGSKGFFLEEDFFFFFVCSSTYGKMISLTSNFELLLTRGIRLFNKNKALRIFSGL